MYEVTFSCTHGISSACCVSLHHTSYSYDSGSFNLYPTNAPRPFNAASYERISTLMQNVRIIAPLVVCTLYKIYGQIHVAATLPNYVHMLVMNSNF